MVHGLRTFILLLINNDTAPIRHFIHIIIPYCIILFNINLACLAKLRANVIHGLAESISQAYR
jgi:hypothetical protein